MLTDEQIVKTRKAQQGRYGSSGTAPYADSIQFARAIESASCADRDARIAELEQRNTDLYEDVQRFKEHALSEKDARMALERELAEARKDAERYRWLRAVPNGFKAQRIVNDTPHGMDAAIDAAMKGKE